ncbi:MAG: chromosomal replication initiator protein DnaA [bacterium]
MISKTNIHDIWKQTLEMLRPQMNEETFELWFKPTKAKSIENNILHLQVPNKFYANWLKERYQQKIEALIKEQTGEEVTINYAVTQELGDIIKNATAQIPPISDAKPENVFSEAQFNPKYTFETYIVGSSNRFAQAAAEAVSREPGKAFNPLFLYGGVGLGKTHLMHAIGHQTRQLHPNARVLYITSERFINEFIDSLRSDKPSHFRNKYRNLDCLLIDDIQFLMGKGRSEEEFFYTFNSLFDSHKQIVISSDRPPKEISSLEERLISRFEWGVVADIQPPDLETRIAILRKKAETEKLYVPDDVILFIASRIKSNIRELEGSFIRVVAFSSLTRTQLTVDTAKEIIKDIIVKEEISAPITIENIQKIVSKHFNLDLKDMRSKKRTDAIAFPRQIAMYLSRTLTELSTTDIGDGFGGKDHTTVMHACNKIKTRLSTDPFFAALVNKITHEIKTGEAVSPENLSVVGKS